MNDVRFGLWVPPAYETPWLRPSSLVLLQNSRPWSPDATLMDDKTSGKHASFAASRWGPHPLKGATCYHHLQIYALRAILRPRIARFA